MYTRVQVPSIIGRRAVHPAAGVPMSAPDPTSRTDTVAIMKSPFCVPAGTFTVRLFEPAAPETAVAAARDAIAVGAGLFSRDRSARAGPALIGWPGVNGSDGIPQGQ